MIGFVNPADRTPFLTNSPARTESAGSVVGTPLRRGLNLVIYVVVLGILVVPILSVVVPPLVDYPNHLARMHILAAYSGSPALQAKYVVAWKLSPYLAMDLIIPWLVWFMPIYTAGRVFLYLCLVLFVLGTLAINLALHRRFSPWPAASGLFAFSYVTSLGFVNYLFGVGIWLVAFAGWIVLSRCAMRVRIMGGILLSLAVFFCHFFAFFGYMLCVGAYEFGIWLTTGDREPMALLRRGIVAFCAFIPALIIFVVACRAQHGGDTWYGSPSDKFITLFSPVLFQGVPYNLGILVALLYVPFRKGWLGTAHLTAAMHMPLLAVAVAAAAMPNVLVGVWGADFRLPVVFVFLLIASCSWTGVSTRAAIAVTGFMATLLVLNIGMIVWAWRPIGQQFDEFRQALPAIPTGAKVIVFRDEHGTDPAMLHQPISIYDHLSMLAVIERDAYIPFLFKHAMMPVAAAPAVRNIDTAVGNPIELYQLLDGMDPVEGPAMLGRLSNMGMINYWGNWPQHFDYAVEFSFGARPELPPLLERVASGTFFNIYRIRH